MKIIPNYGLGYGTRLQLGFLLSKVVSVGLLCRSEEVRTCREFILNLSDTVALIVCA